MRNIRLSGADSGALSGRRGNCELPLCSSALIIDGDIGRVEQVSCALIDIGIMCDICAAPSQLIESKIENRYNFIIIGEGSSGANEIEMLRRIRRCASTKKLPIVVLGSGGEDNIISMIDAGADIYEKWPVTPALLSARVRAVLRLCRKMNAGQSYEIYGPYEFNFAINVVKISGVSVVLTRIEFEVALNIFRNAERGVSIERLGELVWPEYSDSVRHTVIVHICRIRRKLGLSGGNGYILNFYKNCGYVISKVSGPPKGAVECD